VRFERTRTAAERARARGEQGYERLQAARPRVAAIDAGFAFYERDRTAAGGILAGALAYRFFITLLPLMLVLVAGLGYLSATSKEAPADAAEEFGISGAAASSVANSARATSSGRLVAILVGVVALVWAAFWAVRAIRLAHAIAWQLPERRWRRNSAAALFYVGVLVAMAAVGVGDAWLREQLDTTGLLMTIASTGIYFAIWLGASWYLPRAATDWKALVPGAILVAVGIQVLQIVTVVYITPRLDSATATYGALGVALVILLWLYLLGRLVIASAMMNATLWERGVRRAALDGSDG
jgi:uncharacterized BrkB/YihY/UPF0761 family membrane protein